MPRKPLTFRLKRVGGSLGIETRDTRVNRFGIRTRDRSWKILTIMRRGGNK